MDEVTCLLEGQMRIKGELLVGPVSFLLERREVADPDLNRLQSVCDQSAQRS